jgi:hypothetical protein
VHQLDVKFYVILIILNAKNVDAHTVILLYQIVYRLYVVFLKKSGAAAAAGAIWSTGVARPQCTVCTAAESEMDSCTSITGTSRLLVDPQYKY